MQDQGVSHAVNVDAFCSHPDVQLCSTNKTHGLKNGQNLCRRMNIWIHVSTWMFPHPSVYDLCDVFDGLRVVLHAVVGQGDVVEQRWSKEQQSCCWRTIRHFQSLEFEKIVKSDNETSMKEIKAITDKKLQKLWWLFRFLFVWLITWDVSQHLHGCHELPAGLFIFAVLVKQTAHVVDVVWVVLWHLLQQQLSVQNTKAREREGGVESPSVWMGEKNNLTAIISVTLWCEKVSPLQQDNLPHKTWYMPAASPSGLKTVKYLNT